MEIKLCYFIIYFIEALILFQYTDMLFQEKYQKYVEFPLLLLTYTLLYLVSWINNYLLNTVLFFLANLAFIFTMYHVKMQSALFHAAIVTTVMSSSELIIFNAISHYRPDFFVVKDRLFNIVILTIISKLLYFLIMHVLSHVLHPEKENTNPPDSATFLLAFVPMSTVFVLMTLIDVSTKSATFLSTDWMLSVSSFLMLGLNLFIFSFHHYIQKENAKRTELELLLQKEYDSTEYYKMLLQQNENQNILIHDIKKHLQAISILNENKDYDKISDYIRHLLNSSSLQNNFNLCEHKVLNSILGQYKRQCLEKHIDFQVDIRHKAVDFMVTSDLTALFCNLLDNSVESAEKTTEPVIELTVSRKQNTPYTIITLVNSCRQNPFYANTSHLFTKKSNKQRHGFGMKSIQKIVSKYHGELTIYYENETHSFHSIITLKNH